MEEKSFSDYFELFILNLQNHINETYMRKFGKVSPAQVSYKLNKNFAKIILSHSDNGGRSVHCFVALKDSKTKTLGEIKQGDVLKPASWKGPAKHVRGTILTEDFSKYGVNEYGASYL